MKYFVLGAAGGTFETGSVYPQCESMSEDYNYQADDSILHIHPDKLPETPPNLHSFQLKRNAELTDLITASNLNFGLLVSDRLKSILQTTNLPEEHRFYPASVVQKNALFANYYWLHFISDLSEKLDFKRTSFYLDDTVDVQPITIRSADELRQAYQNLDYTTFLRSHRYLFKDAHKQTLDLFNISFIDSRIFISELLAEKLKSNNITGVEIIANTEVNGIEKELNPVPKV